MNHTSNCRWQLTTPEACEYRQTHQYCPHREHRCSCMAGKGEPRDVVILRAENARLREQVEALAGAIQRENGVCVWEQTDTCTGQHFPHTCFRPLLHEAADAALRAYREWLGGEGQ